MQFGFLRSNSNISASQQIVVQHGIDNWRVVIYPAPNPGCTGLPECSSAVDCDDFDACTTNTCSGGTCASTSIDCDDGKDCSADSCADGACVNDPFGDFDLVEAKVNDLITILKGSSCGTDPLARPLARKLRKRVVKIRGKINHADAATRATAITRFLGKADTLLDAASTFVATALNRNLISSGCADALQGFLGDIQMCVSALPRA